MRLKNKYLILIGLIALFLLIAHTFSLPNVVVDSYSLLLLLILIFLPIIPSFKKIKWGDFEAEISQTEIKKMEQSLKDKVIEPLPKDKVKGYTLEAVNELKEYLFLLTETDPSLALAKLRMELEDAIKNIYDSDLIKEEDKQRNLFRIPAMIATLEKQSSINKAIVHNTKEVIVLCNKAIHGGAVSSEQAYGIVKVGIIIISYFYGYNKEIDGLSPIG
jgi:hypothetical protein